MYAERYMLQHYNGINMEVIIMTNYKRSDNRKNKHMMV